MGNTSERYPTEVLSNGQWANADRVKAEDANFASLGEEDGSICSEGGFVGVLYARAFSIGLPLGASPTGFVLRLKQCYAMGLPDSGPACGMRVLVRLVKNPNEASAWRSQALSDTATDYSLGGADDLWGMTWTRDEVALCTVGLDVRCDSTPVDLFPVLIDAVSMIVYHSGGATSGGDPCGGSSGNQKGGTLYTSEVAIEDDDEGDGLQAPMDMRKAKPQSYDDVPMIRCTASGLWLPRSQAVQFKGKWYAVGWAPTPGPED